MSPLEWVQSATAGFSCVGAIACVLLVGYMAYKWWIGD